MSLYDQSHVINSLIEKNKVQEEFSASLLASFEYQQDQTRNLRIENRELKDMIQS